MGSLRSNGCLMGTCPVVGLRCVAVGTQDLEENIFGVSQGSQFAVEADSGSFAVAANLEAMFFAIPIDVVDFQELDRVFFAAGTLSSVVLDNLSADSLPVSAVVRTACVVRRSILPGSLAVDFKAVAAFGSMFNFGFAAHLTQSKTSPFDSTLWSNRHGGSS